MYYLAEITPDDFLGGNPPPATVRSASRFLVCSPSESDDRDDAKVWSDLEEVRRNFRKAALAAVYFLVKVAQSGQPLRELLDGDAYHEAHSFYCETTRKTEKVWRYRKGAIRVIFYHGRDRVILLSGVLVKLTDTLSNAELSAVQSVVEDYLLACAEQTVQIV